MIKIAVKLIKCGCWKVRFADQDYYSSQEKIRKKKEIRATYCQNATVYRRLSKPKASAAKILALEIKMSNPRLDRVERRDGRLQYNPMTIAELQKMTPAINWKTILQVLVLQNWIP
jgi:endothelin-converting enzyme/putative endopeptidase